MHWKHPHHSWWLSACLLGLGISTWAGGFNLGLTVMFVIIFAVGAVLMSQSEPDVQADDADLEPAEAD